MASALVDTCLGHFVAPYTHLFFKTQTVLSYVIEIESYILLFFLHLIIYHPLFMSIYIEQHSLKSGVLFDCVATLD